MTVRKVRKRIFCKPTTKEEWEQDNRPYFEALVPILGTERAREAQEAMWREIEEQSDSIPPEGAWIETEMVQID